MSLRVSHRVDRKHTDGTLTQLSCSAAVLARTVASGLHPQLSDGITGFTARLRPYGRAALLDPSGCESDIRFDGGEHRNGAKCEPIRAGRR